MARNAYTAKEEAGIRPGLSSRFPMAISWVGCHGTVQRLSMSGTRRT